MDKLKELYNSINKLDEENPAELSRIITLYSRSLQLIGNYHADASRTHGKAYATRKTTWGKTMHDTVGTGIVKEGAAEIAIYVLRKDEAEAESEVWKRSEEHTSELQLRGHLVCRRLLEKKNRRSSRVD